MMSNRPERIYKYQDFSVQSLLNLKNQVIYFSPPKNFNDPYDCAISARATLPTKDEIEVIRDDFLADESLAKEVRERFRNATFEEFTGLLISRMESFLEQERQKAVSSFGISCFTEKNDNLLMWSHYADRFRGFCLEFDTSKEPFQLMRKVEYSELMPQIDPVPLLIESDVPNFLELFCTKSIDWSYEKEWRSIHESSGTEFTYEKDVLKGIYFGPQVDKSVLEIICTLMFCQNPEVKLYKGMRSDSEFKVLFQEFRYFPNFLAEDLLAHKGE